MRIYRDLSEVSHNKNSVVTLGTFDGVHLGHRKIIEEVVKKAALLGGRSFLITFYPHPRKIISRENKIELLSTPSEKVKMTESLGIENMLIIKFDKEFSQLGPDKFIEIFIVVGIGSIEFFSVYYHVFGIWWGWDINSLKKKGKDSGFEVTAIPACDLDGIAISSSKIRRAISEGDIKLANKYLGRFYSFSGKVIRGDKRGRELGFPTANLEIENNDKLLPAIGIYAVEFIVKEKKHFGLLSVGKRPTFYDAGDIVPEVYIYDFDGNIYDEFVTVNVVERIRCEEKFSSADELVKQMNKDKKIGIEILKKLNN